MASIPDRLLFRPDVSPSGHAKCEYSRCCRLLTFGVGCCCCCHHCCQTAAALYWCGGSASCRWCRTAGASGPLRPEAKYRWTLPAAQREWPAADRRWMSADCRPTQASGSGSGGLAASCMYSCRQAIQHGTTTGAATGTGLGGRRGYGILDCAVAYPSRGSGGSTRIVRIDSVARSQPVAERGSTSVGHQTA